ncbi:hypothetical protein Tco_0617325 [Tanacetum coccineum]
MVEEEPVKKFSKKELLKLDEELTFKLQAEEDEEERLAREKAQKQKSLSDAEKRKRLQLFVQISLRIEENTLAAQKGAEAEKDLPPTKAQQKERVVQESLIAEIAQESSSKRAGEALEQESSKKQKVDDDKETEELKQFDYECEWHLTLRLDQESALRKGYVPSMKVVVVGIKSLLEVTVVSIASYYASVSYYAVYINFASYYCCIVSIARLVLAGPESLLFGVGKLLLLVIIKVTIAKDYNRLKELKLHEEG